MRATLPRILLLALITTAVPLSATQARVVADAPEVDAARALGDRVAPLLVTIETASADLVADAADTGAWQVIKDAAADGLGLAMDTPVHECSKDYWAMTYATFGLFYMASARALSGAEQTRATAELNTALTTTRLAEAALRRVLEACEPTVSDAVEPAARRPGTERPAA